MNDTMDHSSHVRFPPPGTPRNTRLTHENLNSTLGYGDVTLLPSAFYTSTHDTPRTHDLAHGSQLHVVTHSHVPLKPGVATPTVHVHVRVPVPRNLAPRVHLQHLVCIARGLESHGDIDQARRYAETSAHHIAAASQHFWALVYLRICGPALQLQASADQRH